MDIKIIFSTVAGVLTFICLGVYILSILRGKTKPVRTTWIIWLSLDSLALFGMLTENSANGQIMAVVVGGLFVVLLSFKYGVPGWSNLDKFCLFGSVLGIFLWLVTKSATLGIITSQAVMVMGSFPTFKSVLEDHTREDKTAWVLGTIATIFQLFAVSVWDFNHGTQPVAFMIVNSTMMYLLFVQPRLKHKT